MAAPDRFIAWCKQEQASIEQRLELLQTGKVREGEDGVEADMRPSSRFRVKRGDLLAALVTVAILLASPFQISALAEAPRTTNALPSWNDGPAKQAIMDFVKSTTHPSSPNFVPSEARIATFDQDGTLWVEHPIYSQVLYCLDRVPALVKAKPELANVEPFKTVLSGDREAIALYKRMISKRSSLPH